jgi:hypothetical protein
MTSIAPAAAAILALALAFPAGAFAQEDPAEPYLHLGPMVVHPSLAVSATYSDNVFATAADTESDFYTTVSLGLNLTLPSETKEISIGVTADVENYADFSDLDRVDWQVYGRGVFSVQESLIVDIEDVYTPGHLDPLESTSGTLESYISNAATVGLRYEFLDLWQARLGYTKTTFDYKDSENRSRDEDLVAADVSFRAFPRTSIFAAYDFTAVGYDDPASTLDNTRQDFSLGATWEITDLTRGTAEAGYRSVDFEDPAEEDWTTWGALVELQHELSDLTTLSVKGERSIEEGKYEGTRYISATGLAAGLSHQFLDRLAGNVNAGFFWEDFSDVNPGDSVRREDRSWRAGLSGSYSFRSWLQFNLSYGSVERNSNIDHYDSKEHTVTFQAVARF